MKCLRCSKTIDPEEAKKIEEAGVEPFCSEYCCLVYSGVPLPYSSQGDGVISDMLNKCYGKRNRELPFSGDEKEKWEDCKVEKPIDLKVVEGLLKLALILITRDEKGGFTGDAGNN